MLGSDTATPPSPLEAAAALRSAKEQLHNDIATILEAFTADTGLRVSGLATYSQPQYLDPADTLRQHGASHSLSLLDPNRPYRYTITTTIDI